MATNNIANKLPAGKIAQIVYATGAGSSTSSTTAVDITGSSVAITPTLNTSLILVIGNFAVSASGSLGTTDQYKIQALRTATIINGSPYALLLASLFGGNCFLWNTATYVYVDNPATTSATTYKFQQWTNNAAVTAASSNGTVILMELLV